MVPVASAKAVAESSSAQSAPKVVPSPKVVPVSPKLVPASPKSVPASPKFNRPEETNSSTPKASTFREAGLLKLTYETRPGLKAYDIRTSRVTTLIGSPHGVSVLNGPTALDTAHPRLGPVFVADYWTHRIKRIPLICGKPDSSTFCGSALGTDDGEAGRFIYPMGVAVGLDGKLFVGDWGSSRIRTVTPNSRACLELLIRELEIMKFNNDLQAQSTASLSTAQVAAHRNTTTRLEDAKAMLARTTGPHCSSLATVATLAGSGYDDYADGVGPRAIFCHPSRIALSANKETLYVCDSGNNCVRVLTQLSNPAGAKVLTLAGSSKGFAKGTGASAKFNGPMGITVDGQRLLVSDTGNNCIRAVSIASGDSSVVVAGDPNQPGHRDGPASQSLFKGPMGLRVSSGVIYVADSGNHCIRAISHGQVFTLAGGLAQGWCDGDQGDAMFNDPVDLCIIESETGQQELLVADKGNNALRRVSLLPKVRQKKEGTPLAHALIVHQ